MSKRNINNITYCEIDQASFPNQRQFKYHLVKLGVSQKDYYDKYIKKDGEGVCLHCKNESIFNNIGLGYTKFCSLSCSGQYKKINDGAREQMIKRTKETKLRKYGNETYVNSDKMKETKLAKYGNSNYNNIEKQKETLLEKYGVDVYTKTKEYKEKVKKTSIEKYGVDHFTKSEIIKNKSKETCIEKYGVEHVLQDRNIRARIEKTNLEKYGGYTLESPKLRDKVKSTMLAKYGVDIPLKSTDIKQKQQATNIERYGGIAPTKSRDVIEKMKQTNLEKYGAENTFNTIQVKNTFLEKYGVTNASQIEGHQDKVKQTCLEKYGNEKFFNTDYYKEKSKQTCLEKYGVENVMHDPEIRKRALKTSCRSFVAKEYITAFGNAVDYQTLPELEFIKLCDQYNIEVKNGPLIDYFHDGKNRKYYSDYIIKGPDGQRIVEIKRPHQWWMQDLKSGVAKAKAKAAISYSKKMGYLPYKILFETKLPIT